MHLLSSWAGVSWNDKVTVVQSCYFASSKGESQSSVICTQKNPVCGVLVCEMGIILQGNGEVM